MSTHEIDEAVTVAPDNATQLVLTFDDNRLVSMLFGQYGRNLALIERRLGVVANSRGNQVTLEGSREAREQARRVLENLYERLKRGDELVQGDVDANIRHALAQGSTVRFRSHRHARELRRDQPTQAARARTHGRPGHLCAHS